MNLAEQFRMAGIVVGDYVEMAGEPDWLSKELGDNRRQGELVEVTAIGVESILGFMLVGEVMKDKTYDGCIWTRYGKEQRFAGKRLYFRRVGYPFVNPEMVNIYTRCQEQ